MKKTVTICLICICVVSIIFARQERIALWKAVSLTAELPKPHGNAQLKIETTGDWGKLQISSMKLILEDDEEEIIIPKKAFEDLLNPQLNSVQIRSAIGYDQKFYIYIYFEYGDKALKGKGEFPSVSISICEGKVLERSIKRQLEINQWKHDDMKL
ncbi:MAG: hypothetical protein JW983_04595 [Elusimicrobia bacterium]|nr:hypothetical protein [Elusimicrobiota bacterium]